MDTVTGMPAASIERISRTSSLGRPATGTPTGTSRLKAPAGSRPSTSTIGAPAVVASSTVSSESRPRGSSAARPATVLVPSSAKKPAMPRAAAARLTGTTEAVTVLPGAPPSGSASSNSTRRPALTCTRTVGVAGRPSAAATVRAAGAPPGPAMLPYAGPARPSFPAGTTTSMSSSVAPATARESGPSAKDAYGSATPTSAMRAASKVSPSSFGSTAASSPATIWSVRE